MKKRVCVVAVLAAAAACPQPSPPAPAVVSTFAEFPTNIGRGGRTVAVSVSAANPQIAIAGAEAGGLFRTTDGGTTWKHIDAFTPFRIHDVAFAEPGASNTNVVLVTTWKDAQMNAAANAGGIWRSTDAGVTWTHLSVAGCAPPASAFDIAFAGANHVFVAAPCGLLESTDLGATWTTRDHTSIGLVVARPLGTTTVLDVCTTRARHRRSTDGGVTWTGSNDVVCEPLFPHSMAGSPIERDVLFAILETGEVMESDDGGVTWPFDLEATSFSEGRPLWLRTRQSMDGNPAHFDLHFNGRVATCTSTPGAQRCRSNALVPWRQIPGNPLNHDISGVAFTPGSPCPVLMSADFGVFRAGPATPAAPCGVDAGWTQVGKASAGLHALEIYQMTGQLQYPISGGASVSGSTHLYFGTQDNLIWANYDAGTAGWQGFGAEGSYLQVLYENSLLPPADLQLTYLELGLTPAAPKRILPTGGGGWVAPNFAWTLATPPGTGTPPVLIEPHTYVQWSGSSLYLTTDNAVSFTAIATLPANPADPMTPLTTTRFGATRVTKTTAGPALYEFVEDGTRNGLALLTQISATPTPRVMDLRTFGGLNAQGFSSGLTRIMKYGHENFLLQPVFAVDPNDYRNLIAADEAGNVVQSSDAGRTWLPMIGLTNLVTRGGAIAWIDIFSRSQVRAIAYDPGNSQHILVGTDQAGIVASANGGVTWSALPGTSVAPAISSFFFDDRTGVVYVSTYGRGLWKLTVDWTTVGKL